MATVTGIRTVTPGSGNYTIAISTNTQHERKSYKIFSLFFVPRVCTFLLEEKETGNELKEEAKNAIFIGEIKGFGPW
jgi:hypothetical protein